MKRIEEMPCDFCKPDCKAYRPKVMLVMSSDHNHFYDFNPNYPAELKLSPYDISVSLYCEHEAACALHQKEVDNS